VETNCRRKARIFAARPAECFARITENSESWRMMQARMENLSRLLDRLTEQAMTLIRVGPCGANLLQEEMAAMRTECRKVVKRIRKDVTEQADALNSPQRS